MSLNQEAITRLSQPAPQPLASPALASYQALWLKLALDPTAEETLLKDETSLKAWLDKQQALLPKLSTSLQQQFLQVPLSRLRQYAFMVRSNVAETLDVVYPYTRQLLSFTDEQDWANTVDAYLQAYPPASYQLQACVQHLPQYLESNEAILKVYPFLPQLAAYEQAEAVLLSAPNVRVPSVKQLETGLLEDLQCYKPVLNPIYKLVSGAYAIQNVVAALQASLSQESWLPLEPKTTHLWIYRDAQTLVCRFFEVNPMVLGFLQAVAKAGEKPNTYAFYLEQLLGEQAQQSNVQQQFSGLIAQLVQSGLLLGSLAV